MTASATEDGATIASAQAVKAVLSKMTEALRASVPGVEFLDSGAKVVEGPVPVVEQAFILFKFPGQKHPPARFWIGEDAPHGRALVHPGDAAAFHATRQLPDCHTGTKH